MAQLAGYVSEHSAYHHGEASLSSTIVGLAQNFVGSNNVNLLYPSGGPARSLPVYSANSAKCQCLHCVRVSIAAYRSTDDPAWPLVLPCKGCGSSELRISLCWRNSQRQV